MTINNNKKTIVFFVTLIFVLSGLVYAQTNTLPDHGILPDSSLYFLKNWGENIRTFFTFSNEAKAERFLNLSGVRLAEAKALMEKGDLELAETTLERYQEQLTLALSRAKRAEERGSDVEETLIKVSEVTLRHQEALLDVYDKVPEKAQSAIGRAMKRSMRGHEEAFNAISSEKGDELEQEIWQKRREIEERIKSIGRDEVFIPETPKKRGVEEESIPPKNEKPEASELLEGQGRGVPDDLEIEIPER